MPPTEYFARLDEALWAFVRGKGGIVTATEILKEPRFKNMKMVTLLQRMGHLKKQGRVDRRWVPRVPSWKARQ